VRGTVLLVTAVIALGIAATVDALRGDGREAVPEPTTTRRISTTPSPVADLRAVGVSGTIYLTLRADEGCALQVISLPGLETRRRPAESCRFDVSSEGNIATGRACPARTVEVHNANGSSRRLTGCAPAWKPSGELTFVRDGDVVTEDGEVLVDDVALAASAWLPGVRTLTVRELGWLTETRLVAAVGGSRAGWNVLVVSEGGQPAAGGDVQTGANINVSRERQEIYVAHPRSGAAVHNRHGAFVSQGRFPFPDVVALTDSPDGRWTAVARPDNVCIYERRDPPPREEFPVACVPFDAVDLAWR
jgi:hypothetical protein